MRRLLLAVIALTTTHQATAQVIVVPPAIIAPGTVILVPSGASSNYHRRKVTVTGFYGSGFALVAPYGPYGPSISRVATKVFGPAVPRPDVPDLSGVDLDVVGPEALQPGYKPGQPKNPAPINKNPAEKMDVPAKRPVFLELPKKEMPPPKPAPVPPPALKPPANLGQQKAEPLEESRRLVDLGLLAFSAQEYGLAAMRFRQASEIAAEQPRPYFLLAQAYLALGKYKEAVAAIENGMKRQEDWPLSAFQPRQDLYKGIEEDWFAHKKQLADAAALHPDKPAYLFLLAYELWFVGQRDLAAELFERARRLAPDNPFIRTFLRVMPKLAAN